MLTATRSTLLLVVVLIVAACGGGAPATGRPSVGLPSAPAGATVVPSAPTVEPPVQGGLDACGIVTTAEIQAIVGSAVTAESGGQPIDGQTICTFRTADGEGILYTSYNPDGTAGFDLWKSSANAEGIPAVGDEAIYEPTIGLMVRRGTETFQFYPLADLNDAASLSLAVELARTAGF